ncbi:cyclin-O [Synchiropus splendidus]|uniref:cyclin-O n=1 Tax=Synchiropus splendidus TaxID=270530 RepID=UPI00237EB471|nr:cyclin-O [Synchiropus splendidus]
MMTDEGRSESDEAVEPTQQRSRKQKLIIRMNDSGFEEDLGSPPEPPGLRVRLKEQFHSGGQFSSWYRQYGTIGYRLQREKEATFHPCRSLARQPQLTSESRCKLISWLIPVHKHFRLSFECCCLAVNIIDRFLETTPVAPDCFQLVGVTALLLASKKVEVCSPRITHLLSLCCDVFTREQLCNLECLILMRLDFHLSSPTLAFFLDYYTRSVEEVERDSEMTQRNHFCDVAQLVCELSLADYAFNKYPPSLIARCALRLVSEMTMTEHRLLEPIAHPLFRSDGDETDNIWENIAEHSIRDGTCPMKENHSLAQECKDNLKLLVSLNQESLNLLLKM